MNSPRNRLVAGCSLLLAVAVLWGMNPAQAAEKKPAMSGKPNVLVLWGDDIGYWNISAYNRGMMGYKTPNIDRIVKEGALYTNWYGEQSHLDGYNVLDSLAGKGPDPRHEFMYFNDDGSLVGLRYNQWKIVFAEQRAEGFDVWQEPFVTLRVPKIFNLRADPFEKGDLVGMDYAHWRADRLFLLVPAQQYVAQFLASFKDYPPSQRVGSFSLDNVLKTLSEPTHGSN